MLENMWMSRCLLNYFIFVVVHGNPLERAVDRNIKGLQMAPPVHMLPRWEGELALAAEPYPTKPGEFNVRNVLKLIFTSNRNSARFLHLCSSYSFPVRLNTVSVKLRSYRHRKKSHSSAVSTDLDFCGPLTTTVILILSQTVKVGHNLSQARR